MWCKNCNIETNETNCPICGEETVEDYPTEVYWCDECRVPVIQAVNQADKGTCPRCGKLMKYLAADIRLVFPEDELILDGKNEEAYCKYKDMVSSLKQIYSG